MKTLITHGRCATPEGVQPLDLLLEGEHIAALGAPGSLGSADQAVDAAGCYVLPGLMDFHTHLDDRIGRFELADTCESGGRLALQHGITTLFGFITQGPGETLLAAIRRTQARARPRTHLVWHLTPTRWDPETWRELEVAVALGFRTVKLYTTYRANGLYLDYETLADLLPRLATLGVRVLIHAEDEALLQGAAFASPRASDQARLRPEAAEVQAVARLLDLAHRAGTRLHFVHVSTLAAAHLIQASKARQDVTCETCPQYLWLDASRLDGPEGHRWICSPPLRDDREAFRDHARSGGFDLLATDHCAFSRKDKDDWDGRDIRTVASGLPGIGALLPLAWRLWEAEPDRAAREVARACSELPARLAGLFPRKGALVAGADADLVVLDPDGTARPLRGSLADVHEPYAGFSSRLSARHVWLGGRRAGGAGEPRGKLLQERA
jgi:dihydropyrimidinase